MSITSSELAIICDELNGILSGRTLRRAVQFDRKRLLLSVSGRGHGENVLICLEDPFLRIHLTREGLKGKRNRFPFGALLERNLAGFTVEEIRQLNDDRIAEFRVARKGQVRFVLVELIRGRSNIYLLDESRNVIADWRGEIAGQEYSPKRKTAFRPTAPRFTACKGETFSSAVEKEYQAAERRAAFEKEKNAVFAVLRRKEKKTKRLLDNLKEDEEKAAGWEELHRKAELLKSNLSSLRKEGSVARVVDWATGDRIAIVLDVSLTVQQNMERMFERSKKLKRGLSHIRRRVRATEEKLSQLKTAMQRLNAVDDPAALQAFLEKAKDIVPSRPEAARRPRQARSGPFRVFTSREGFKIFVGRNDAENDRLTFSFARGRDLWFHARDFPGSHVVARAQNRREIGRETILDGANLALYYSKGRAEGTGDVIYTERKYLAKPKGLPPGKLNVSKHRVLHIRLDEEKIKSLRRAAPGTRAEDRTE